MADNNIRVKIEGIDKLTPILKQLNDTLNKVNQTLSKFSNIATNSFNKVNQSTEKTVSSYRKLKREAKQTINEIAQIYKKAETLGGFSFLTPVELGRAGGLKRKLSEIKKQLPYSERMSVDIYQFNKLDATKIKQKKKQLIDLQKQQDRLLKQHIRLVNNSSKVEERQLKKLLSIQERRINQLLQETQLSGRVGLFQKFKIKSEIDKYNKLAKQLSKKGFIIPDEANVKLNKFRTRLAHLNREIGTSKSLLHEWWKRFGAVALGFTVMYRVMVYLEQGIGAVVNQIRQGIQAFDDFQQTIVRTSLFYQIFGGVRDFGKSMEYATSTVEGLKYATVDALSPLDDITQGLDELAQHGVFLSASMMKDFVNLTDFIGMIAKTTGSQANQIRQELQALFEGTQRAGNTLIRFIAKAFGKDVVKQLQNATTPAEQFYIIMQKISNFMKKHKMVLFEKSFEMSLTRAKNIFTLMVADSLRLVNNLKELKQGVNPLAEALNKSLAKVGFDKFQDYNNAKLTLMKIKRDYLEGKVSLETLIDAQQKYNKALEDFSKTPASKIINQLANVMLLLSDKVIPLLVDGMVSFVNALSKAIVYIQAFYQKNKDLIDTLATIIKYLVIFRVSMFGLRFILTEPINLIRSLGNSLLSLSFVLSDMSLKGIKKIPSVILLIAKSLNLLRLRIISAITSTISLFTIYIIKGKIFTVMKTWITTLADKMLILATNVKKVAKAFILLSVNVMRFVLRLSPALLGIWALYNAIFHPDKMYELGKVAMNHLGKAVNEGLLKIVDTLSNSTLSEVLGYIFNMPAGIVQTNMMKAKKLLKENVEYYEENLGKLPKLKDVINDIIKTDIEDVKNALGGIDLKDVFSKLFDVDVSKWLDFGKGTAEKVYNLMKIKVLNPLKKKVEDYFNIEGLDIENYIAKTNVKAEIRPKVKKKIDLTPLLNELKKQLDTLDNLVKDGVDKVYSRFFNIDKDKYIQMLKSKLQDVENQIRNILTKLQQVPATSDKYGKYINILIQLGIKYEDLRKKIKEFTYTHKKSGITLREFWDWYTYGVDFAVERNKIALYSLRDIADQLFQSVGDGLYGFLTGRFKTLKDFIFNIRDMVLKILTDMIAKLIQAKIMSIGTNVAAAGFGGGVGIGSNSNLGYTGEMNALKNSMNLNIWPTSNSFASGGVISKRGVYQLAEKGAEAVIPLDSGNKIPVAIKNLPSNAQPTNITTVVNVNALDPISFVEYEQRTGAVSSIVREAVVKDLQNNGIIRNSIKKFG